MVHWPLRWVPLQKPSNNLSVYPNLLPSDWGQVEIWNLIRHILGFNLFSLSQVQVKHHISCLPNGFWQPGVRNFSWDSVNKPGFMLEMHKCTLSRMASTHCWRSLSLQIEMQVSLRHFLCFPSCFRKSHAWHVVPALVRHQHVEHVLAKDVLAPARYGPCLTAHSHTSDEDEVLVKCVCI